MKEKKIALGSSSVLRNLKSLKININGRSFQKSKEATLIKSVRVEMTFRHKMKWRKLIFRYTFGSRSCYTRIHNFFFQKENEVYNIGHFYHGHYVYICIILSAMTNPVFSSLPRRRSVRIIFNTKWLPLEYKRNLFTVMLNNEMI